MSSSISSYLPLKVGSSATTTTSSSRLISLIDTLSYHTTRHALLLTIVISVSIATWLVLFIWNARARHIPNIPGPRQLPFLGNAIEVLMNEPRLNKYIIECRLKYGNVFHVALPLSPPYVFTANPDDVRHILRDNFNNYPKGLPFMKVFEELLGRGIFATDGATWRTQRKTAAHAFNPSILRSEMTPVFVKHAKILIDKLEKAVVDKSEIDIFEEFNRLTLDSIAVIAFGVNPQTQSKGKVPFAEAFDKAQHVVDKRFLAPYWQFTRALGIGDEAEMAKALKVIDEFATHVINERKKMSRDQLESKTDLLSKFVAKGKDDEGNVYTDKDYKDVILNFVIAGRDTTAQNLSWSFYELGLHPECDRASSEEARKLLGKDNIPTFEDAFENMPYIAAVQSEALRLHPSVPKEMKHAIADDTLPSGTKIPAGTAVLPAIQALMRRTDVWGEDAEEFRPERWLEMDSEPNSFDYPAFQAGPRTCLGKNMAQLEARIVTSMIIKDYRLELVEETNDYRVEEATALTLPARYGIRCRVHRR